MLFMFSYNHIEQAERQKIISATHPPYVLEQVLTRTAEQVISSRLAQREVDDGLEEIVLHHLLVHVVVVHPQQQPEEAERSCEIIKLSAHTPNHNQRISTYNASNAYPLP